MANKPGEANFFPDVPEFPSMGTFQPVYGKFDLTTYIQGASDYEIMAFLVGKYNACLEAYGNITRLSTDTITACKQLQDWINSWFTNLDVQEEINKKLDKMVADGSFETLMHKAFDAQVNQQTTSAVTTWLVANVTPTGGAVIVDKSLSIEGAAADAKVTGKGLDTRMIAGIHTAFNPNAITDLDTFYTPGSQYVNRDVVLAKIAELNLDADIVNKYYWSVINIAPISEANNNYDVVQFLIGTDPTIKDNKQAIYKRFSFARKWTSFERIDSTFTMGLGKFYEGTTLDFFTLGSNYINNKQAVLNYQSELGLDTDVINEYYWSVINIAPISQANNNYDVIQFLIGTDPSMRNQFIYKRFSFARNWSKFERFGTDLEKIKTPQKVAFLGDSFTEHDSTISYVDYLGEMPEYEVTNLAEGGLTAGTWMDKYSSKITNEYDTYFIAFGLNSDIAGTGAPDSTDNATFYGGFNNLLNTIISTCPKARIIMWCMDAWMSKSRSDMELEIATKYGCEYYSMKADANIPLRIDGKFAGVMEGLSNSVIAAKTAVFARTADNHHPNATAQYMLATYLKNII